jgi:hypothetical protein
MLRNWTFVVSNNVAARQRGGMVLVGAAPGLRAALCAPTD